MLLRLPHELLENILLQLDPLSVKACALWSREFITIIRSSIALRYLLACHAAGVVDNPRGKLSRAARYEALRKREKGWRRLQPVFTQTFDIRHAPSRTCGLTAGRGVYLPRRRHLHYCTIPSTPNDVDGLPSTPLVQGMIGRKYLKSLTWAWPSTSMISSPASCTCCHCLFDG